MKGQCNRCGKCCFYPTGKDNELAKCPNLINTGNSRYACRIYRHRLGTHIGTDINGIKYYCNMYNSLNDEIIGCPVNIGGKPLREVTIKGNTAISIGVTPQSP